MSSHRFVGLLGAGCLLLLSSVARAQCTKDTDCKGDRVCDAGICKTPPSSVDPAPTPAAAPATTAAPAAAPPAAPAAATPTAPPPSPPAQPVKGERHSTGMMVGGIVMVSFAPIALLTALVASANKSNCELADDVYGNGSPLEEHCDDYDATIYGGLISAAALAGIGIPLIVIGGKREPPRVATVQPWVTPQGAGLGLRLDL